VDWREPSRSVKSLCELSRIHSIEKYPRTRAALGCIREAIEGTPLAFLAASASVVTEVTLIPFPL